MEMHAFGTLNYIVLLVYLAAIMMVGMYFAKRQKSADDYFKAGGRIPGWAAGISVFASLSFMLFHIGRIAIITYLTALALMPFIDISPLTIVFLIGVLCIVYTFMGGIEGVIWTDVIQGIMLSAAAVMIFVMICFNVDGGMTEIFRLSAEADKYFPADKMAWSWYESTVPVLMIGFLFASLQQFTASQDVVQRYIVTDSIEETKKALVTNAKLVACIPVFFFAVGAALFAYYNQHPELMPADFNTGGILPFFVISQMPAGIAGLIIAAIFAASQSSISSSLNSISACFTSDVYTRFGGEKSPEQKLKVGRLVTVSAGVFGVIASTYLIMSNESELWDAFNSLIGLMGGPMTGLFMLGVFVRRANANSALLGVVAAVATILWVRASTDLNFFFYGVIGTLVVVLVGFITAPLFKNSHSDEEVKALTI